MALGAGFTACLNGLNCDPGENDCFDILGADC